MAIEKVKAYFVSLGRQDDILEFPVSSATVELAARALNTEPARIAKTLSFYDKKNEKCAILVVTAGDAKIDNNKFRTYFGFKAKMLFSEDVETLTGHPVGGVCPFANPAGTKTYLDISLKRFDTVFPACGSGNSAIELHCKELYTLSGAEEWIDVCKGWQNMSEEE